MYDAIQVKEAKEKIEKVRGGRNYVVKYEVHNRQLIATLRNGVRLWAFIG